MKSNILETIKNIENGSFSIKSRCYCEVLKAINKEYGFTNISYNDVKMINEAIDFLFMYYDENKMTEEDLQNFIKNGGVYECQNDLECIDKYYEKHSELLK